MSKRLLLGGILLGLIAWAGLRRGEPPRPIEIRGPTMGTTYCVTLVGGGVAPAAIDRLRGDIELELSGINRTLSTYDPASEISRFNQQTSTAPCRVSATLHTLLAFALRLSAQSDGAFDPTIEPLVQAWGFGAGPATDDPPEDARLRDALSSVGRTHVHTNADSLIRKDLPGVRLNLNAIAEGYAIDRLAARVRAAGCTNYMVEIGGEFAVAGHRPGGGPWRLRIEEPLPGGLPDVKPPHAVVELSYGAVASSGDYRNYFIHEGRMYSHIIDPRTGRPITNGVAAVTVIGPDGLTADGLATTLMVLGPEAGLRLLSQYPGTEALIQRRGPEGTEEFTSPGFARYRARR
jgi:thiamine biosynthesis lipoprotein